MKSITVKNIYSGKPDAKDEINFDGLSDFIKTFILPQNIDFDLLLSGNHCFISGFKGTGKTALLFYLDNLIRERDESACSSFVFFKEEFAELKKEEFDKFSKRGLSSITIDKDTLLNNSEFEYIWRWLFFKRIVADNEEFNGGLFEDDEQWSSFKKIVSKIKGPINIKKSVIPNRVKLAIPFNDSTGASIAPEMEVDLNNGSPQNNYSSFVKLVDDAEVALTKVSKTDIPYHIFVDELEAYYGDAQVFKRDLYLIRDLIFTIKRFNSIFSSSNMSNIKVICSIRSEIVNAISRFIVTKELNKVTSGFEIPLIWNYNNTNSFSHPIMQILLRRIAISESEDDESLRSDKEIIAQWFPEKIHDIEPSNYVLNNSWHKPRDIVRFIISAQNSINNDSTSFSQSVFSSLHKQYSIDSLNEIREEMRALYTSEQIEDIINVLTGYKSIFSVNQLRNRVTKFFGNSIMDTNFNAVLNDLYRLGLIGNFFPASQMYRWQHKGDDRLIIADEWRIMIHQALQSALSVGKRQDYNMKRYENPQIGDVVSFEVKAITKSFVNGSIGYFGKKLPGYIHISKIADTYIHNLNDFVTEGEEMRAVIIEYDEKYSKWSLSKISES
ncbi:hypothetical protein FZC78_02730 [Rossellomorea vietnamensis]|uniref:S1 motif domain-containing protein n=1 Tax=Rossellomorea vietnamensis TaxID=218284 RepID=A0A5D4P0Z5_9BACI|nr:hypothetical protein [Rossellomorea vietnamensis]TYS18472.1 hypothetical protein FZC78_02730 [Rossellomorea vietnamensis]